MKMKKSNDIRSEFANYCCQLLVDKYNGDIELAATNCKELYDHFWDNVRNIYELIDEGIPLFRLYELKNVTNSSDLEYIEESYGSLEKYQTESIKKCKEYYL